MRASSSGAGSFLASRTQGFRRGAAKRRPLAALPDRLALLGEGGGALDGVAAAEHLEGELVVALPRLGLGEVERLTDELARDAHRDGRVLADALGERDGLVEHLLGGDDPVHEAQLERAAP